MNKIYLVISCIIAVVADMMLVIYSKKQNSSIWLLCAAMFIHLIDLIFWVYAMKKGIDSSVAITMYALCTVAGCSYLGHVMFKEELSTLNIFGLALAIISLIFISIKI